MFWLNLLRDVAINYDAAVTGIAAQLERGRERAAEPPPSAAPALTTAPYDVTLRTPHGRLMRQALQLERAQMVVDAWRQYLGDDRTHAGLNCIGEVACVSDNNGRPFELTVLGEEEGLSEPVKRERKELLAYLNRFIEWEGLDLRVQSPRIATRSILEGDRFYQIVVNWESNDVVALNYLPGPREGAMMHRVEDRDTGALLGWALYDRGGRLLHIYHPWEIVHFCWNRVWRFGLSILVASRLTWNRLAQSEDDMFITRRSRSGLRVVYHNKEWTIEQAKSMAALEEQRERSNPQGPLTNDYTNAEGVQVIDPRNSALRDLADMEYRQNKLFASLRIPQGLLGYGEKLNRATLEMQFQWVLPLLGQVNSMLASGFGKVIRTQMVLKGYDPTEHVIGFNWADKDPTNWVEKAQAIKDLFAEGIIDQETSLERLNFNAAQVKARQKAEAEEARTLESGEMLDTVRMMQERVDTLEAQLELMREVGGMGGDGGGPDEDGDEDVEELEHVLAARGV